ncbi:hypothetical protein ACP70R_001599 [Stipagrostis hirtigluma subsp. patula]
MEPVVTGGYPDPAVPPPDCASARRCVQQPPLPSKLPWPLPLMVSCEVQSPATEELHEDVDLPAKGLPEAALGAGRWNSSMAVVPLRAAIVTSRPGIEAALSSNQDKIRASYPADWSQMAEHGSIYYLCAWIWVMRSHGQNLGSISSHGGSI